MVAPAVGTGGVADAQVAADPVADLVLHSGSVWARPGSGEPDAAAVAIAGQRILAVGANEDVAGHVGPATRVVDLNGALVLPGLRDQHVHVLDTGIPGVEAGAAPPTWSGYDPVQSEALRGAIAAYHASILARSETPEDGCTHSAVTDEMKQGLLDAEREIASQGLTATVEAGLSDLGILEALFALDAEDRLTVRWLPRLGWGCLEDAAALGWTTGTGSEWVRVLGAKLYSDGWLGPRTAALREPYADRPHAGFLFLDAARAQQDVARARELGFNVTTHAIGDRGVATVLDAYEANDVVPDDRWQIEHAQVVDGQLIDRFADLGVIASVQLSFATTDQRFAEDALGADRVATSYPWRTMLDRGVRLVGSSDFPVEVLAPLWGLQRVVTRIEFDGTPPGGWFPEQRVDLATALRLITADAAYASLEESDRGVLAPGYYADLTVLREDLRTLPADCLAAATVLLTVVNGRVAHEGEQAYPPQDATCPSEAAPAAAPVLTADAVPVPESDDPPPPPPLPATGAGVGALLGLGLLAAVVISSRRLHGTPI